MHDNTCVYMYTQFNEALRMHCLFIKEWLKQMCNEMHWKAVYHIYICIPVIKTNESIKTWSAYCAQQSTYIFSKVWKLHMLITNKPNLCKNCMFTMITLQPLFYYFLWTVLFVARYAGVLSYNAKAQERLRFNFKWPNLKQIKWNW